MATLKNNLEAMLTSGNDSADLRLALASHCLKDGEPERAIVHLEVAVDLDPDYSAAWKLLGKALADAHRETDALAAYRKGMQVAEQRGDMQALKEMTVFARRLEARQGQVGTMRKQ